MDAEDLKLGAVAFLLATTGAVGVAAILQGLATDAALVPALVPPTGVVIAAARCLAPERAWSLRLARVACPIAAGLWLMTGVLLGVGDAWMYAVGMAGASVAAWVAVDGRLRGLDVTGGVRQADTALMPPHAWIEDLPG